MLDDKNSDLGKDTPESPSVNVEDSMENCKENKVKETLKKTKRRDPWALTLCLVTS